MSVLYIFGAGGMGRELADIALGNGDYSKIVFVDDVVTQTEIMGCERISCEQLKGRVRGALCVALGEPAHRKSFCERFAAEGFEIVSVFDKSADISTFSTVGAGSIVHKGAIVTCNTQIGVGCLINVNASVSHDCRVGDYTVISPAAAVCGNVTIGSGSFLGAGCVIRNGINIGSGCIIGMGAVVVSDVSDDCVVAGNPARVIRKNDSKRVF